MKKIEIDFSKPTIRHSLLNAGWLFGFVSISVFFIFIIALGTIAYLHHLSSSLQEQIAVLEQQTQRLQNVKKKAEKNPSAVLNQQALILIAAQLNLPWAELMHAFDSKASKQVALLELNPDVTTRLIKVTAEARNSAHMTQYLENLKKLKVISDVRLLHHETNSSDPLLPIRFEIEAYWTGGLQK
jgi:hypothetical protein